MGLKITLSGQTIVKPTALGPVANTDTKLLIYGAISKGPSFGTGRARRVLTFRRAAETRSSKLSHLHYLATHAARVRSHLATPLRLTPRPVVVFF